MSIAVIKPGKPYKDFRLFARAIPSRPPLPHGLPKKSTSRMVRNEVRVLMMPDYRRDNPYQALLAHGLEAEGCRVVFPRDHRGVLPLCRAVRGEQGVDILHLHWTSPYLKGHGLPRFLVYLAKFLADLAAVRIDGCRIVWTLHNLVPHETRHRRLELLARRMICRIVSAVIVHGHAGQKEAVQTLGCPANRVFVIPHGHYRDAYAPPLPSPDARRGWPASRCPRDSLLRFSSAV